ncbi:MAG: pantoate--beta-alanine ligase [Candidatus Korobacteraceae bacterium]
MKRIPTIAEMKAVCRQVTRSGKTLGLVPTMGALHEGHLSLVRAARARCDVTAVSIFVNPLQFGPTEDLAKYPRTLERDCALLEELGVELVFVPTVDEMYSSAQVNVQRQEATQVNVQTKDANLGHVVESANVGPEQSSQSPTHSQPRRMSGAPESSPSKTFVLVEGLSDRLDGASRPGHFRGVSTVVAKLFEIVRPDCAFFGQKDAAQAAVLRKMARDLDMDVEIVVCPIVREKDGLAMSSRNVYLSPEQRQQALVLHRALMRVQMMADQGERDAGKFVEIGKQVIAEEPAARLDYFAIVDADTLDPIADVTHGALVAVAAFFGTTRLIDNIILT